MRPLRMATNRDRLREQGVTVQFFGHIGLQVVHLNVLISEGMRSFSDVVETYKEEGPEEFKKLLQDHNKAVDSRPHTGRGPRTRFTPVAIKRLTGVLHFFLISMYALHICPRITLIDADIADELGAAYYEKLAMDDDEDEDDDTIDTKLPVFRGTNNWTEFRDRFAFKLAHTKNRKGYSLDYVIDDTERQVTHANANLIDVDQPVINADTIRTRAVHFGPQYRRDNKKVWAILKSSLMNTPQFNHIAPFADNQNGRDAWFALRGYYQGEDFQERSRESAFNILRNTFYKGEATKFNFEKYVSKHLEAHKLLLDAGHNDGRGLDEATKIQYLRTGILAEAGLETALSTARAARDNIRDFQMMVTFLSGEVDQLALRRVDLRGARTRRVSAFGRPARPNNNNRTRAPKRRRGEVPFETVDGRRVEARSYQKHEWENLTQNQRDAVIRLNRDRRRREKENARTQTGPGRNINAVRDDRSHLGSTVHAESRATGSDNASDISMADTGSNQRRRTDSGSVGSFLAGNRTNSS